MTEPALGRLRLAVLAILACASTLAFAQKPGGLPDNYPSKPVRVLIGSGPSGGTDLLTRSILGKVAEKWGATFIMENVATLTGGIRALEMTLKAPADGYTILGTSGSTYQNAMFTVKVPFDVRKEFVPTVQYNHSALILVVHPSVPVQSIKELIAYAKANPGKLNVANSGIGTSAHLAAELLKYMAKIDMVSVPYKGAGAAAVDTAAGRTQVLITTPVSLIAFIKSGKIRVLGITSAQRMPSLPDVPTIAEAGVPDYAYVSWLGAVMRAGTPQPILQAINRAAVEAIKSPEMAAKFAADGTDPAHSSLEEFKTIANGALDRAEKLINETGLKLGEG
jgi:tripartite-type tricarboxylate transporter receptor subunit TctC